MTSSCRIGAAAFGIGLVLSLAVGYAALGQSTAITTVRVASGLVRPVWLTHDPGDSSRLFIIEKQGRIRILKNGALLATPFLDIDSLVGGGTTDSSEQGLLGLAFDPNYQTNGYFYVDYTNNVGDTVVARYHVSANPDAADAASALQVLTVDQPYGNHNGGWLGFGPDDKLLYIGMGDGGDANDPGNRAQTITNQLLGKMLRIDPSRDDFPADPARNYGIPPTNPFVGVAGDDEIWAYGLRNPWRPSFDRLTGDLWIADVGQNAREEINFQPAGAGGRNYGWRCMEGTLCTGLSGCTCNAPPLVLPIHDYSHDLGCSVTGGYVYRGTAIPSLVGAYLFADYCSARIWSLRYDGSTVSDFRERTTELAPGFGLSINWISSFGEDAAGELYICDQQGGEVFKIVGNTAAGAKAAPDNAPYTIMGHTVSAVFGDVFYVQDDDRTSGIRVERAGHGLAVGSRTSVTGIVRTNADGERYIAASAVASAGTGSVLPVGLANRSLGGGDWRHDPATGSGQRGVLDGFGLNNIGLLVRTAGTVTFADAAFYVDDGSQLSDGSGHTGVKVYGTVPVGQGEDPVGKLVTVTGILGCERPGVDIVRVIRTRGIGDVTVLQ